VPPPEPPSGVRSGPTLCTRSRDGRRPASSRGRGTGSVRAARAKNPRRAIAGSSHPARIPFRGADSQDEPGNPIDKPEERVRPRRGASRPGVPSRASASKGARQATPVQARAEPARRSCRASGSTGQRPTRSAAGTGTRRSLRGSQCSEGDGTGMLDSVHTESSVSASVAARPRIPEGLAAGDGQPISLQRKTPGRRTSRPTGGGVRSAQEEARGGTPGPGQRRRTP
jgi:hypothetical protein